MPITKPLAILSLTLISLTATAEQKIVPLDIDPGYWKTTVEIEQSQAIKDMLANLPEDQREMVMKQMESSMQSSTSKQCVTEESINDMEKMMREGLGSQGNSCELEVSKSTSTELIAEMKCQGVATVIHTKVINSKRQETTATSNGAGVGETKVNMVVEWESETCPAAGQAGD